MELSAARDLAWRLMAEHGLTDWTFTFDRAARRFGGCWTSRKSITMSAALTKLNDEPHVRDTILHEIAHALEPEDRGHGQRWKARAAAIGCEPTRCYPPTVKKPPATWRGTCPRCGAWWERNRRIRAACGFCSPGVYTPKYRLEWRRAP